MNYSLIKQSITFYACIILTTTLYSMEKAPQSVTEGISGWLYTWSWTLPKPQLLLYAFENNLFDPKNKDHKKLLWNALALCRQNKDTETIRKILTFIGTKPSRPRVLTTKVSRATHNFLTTQQIEQNEATKQQLFEIQKNQLTQILEEFDTIQNKIIDTTAMVHKYKNVQEEQLTAFRTDYRKNRGFTSLLHTIDSDIDAENALDNCSDVENWEEGTLVDPSLRDDTYLNKKVMSYDNQFGKNNILLCSLITELQSLHESTQQLMALCSPSEKTKTQ